MQFIKTGQQIAVENFNIGAIYKVVFADSTVKYMMCVGIGKDFVMLFADMLFALKMKSASKVNTIDLYTPIEPTPPPTNLLQYQTGLPPFEFISSGGSMWSTQILGNTVQNGTPSPQNPVDVVGVGELETSGQHAGQYKIPILNNSQTTNVYLGEVQTVRQIKKLVLTGEERYDVYAYNNTRGVVVSSLLDISYKRDDGLCNIYPVKTTAGSTHCLWLGSGGGDRNLYFVSILDDTGLSDESAFKSWVAQQYTNGTPVVVYYVLATAETTTVNEPLQKIGDYSDSLEFFGKISVSSGNNTLTVGTSIQPSDITIAYPIEVEA